MKEILAYCGIACDQCEAYTATVENNAQLQAEVAEKWNKAYGAAYKAADIVCKGCLAVDGPLFSHCAHCEIRKCSLEHGVANCGHCPEYACGKLQKFFEFLPDAKTRLDEVRSRL